MHDERQRLHEVARVERHVVRLADVPARRVELGLHLRELDEPHEIGQRAVAAFAADAHERRALSRQEHHAIAADLEVVLGVARVQHEFRGRLRDLLEYELRVEAHEIALDPLTCPAEQLERPRLVELHADLGDEALPASLDELDGLGCQGLVARHGVCEHPAIIQLRLHLEVECRG